MNHIFIRILLITLSLLLWEKSQAQMNVQDNQTAQQLVNKLIGANVLILNPVLTCDPTANGTFDMTGPSNLGMSGGIILATGATNTSGTNIGLNGGGWSGGPSITGVSTGGDVDLGGLIGGDQTYSACTLEFDFVPDIDTAATLSFKYVFGSEEYPSFTCSQFNDVFGFLITGAPAYANTNIALVPGTNIPVTINSINSGVPSGGYSIATCNAMGPGSPFPAYFVNNTGTSVRLPGFTTVLEAKATVLPCSTYHMKLGIANVVDAGYQSAVFLLENSFSVDSVQVNLADIIKTDSGYIAEGCSEAKMIITRDTTTNSKKKLCFDYGGTATYGVDYNNLPYTVMLAPKQYDTTFPIIPTVDNTPELPYETIIIRRLNCCTQTAVDSVELRIYDSLQIKIFNNDTGMCGGQVINLHAVGDGNFNYEWSPSNIISNPNDSFTTAKVDQTTTFTVKASFLNCPDAFKSFTATVESTPIVNILTPDKYGFCVGDSLKIEVDVQPSTLTGESYVWSPNYALSDPLVKEPYFYTTVPGVYRYILAVQTPQLGCTGSDSIFIDAKPGVKLINVSADTIVRYADYLQLHAEGALFYNWMPTRNLDYPTTSDPKAQALDTTLFMVIGMNEYGCTDTEYVKMGIDYTMHEMIPTGFSPNGDGKNDIFSIKNMNFQRLLEFKIYNRWGQEVFATTDSKKGWDGTYKGVAQELGVYNYIIRVVIPNGQQRVYKGNVTLVR